MEATHGKPDNGQTIAHMNTPPSLPPVLTPPPVIPPSSQASSYAKQAALFSLLAPLISVGTAVILGPITQGSRIGVLIQGSISTLWIIGGLVLGIIALVATKKHGRAGIFGKALAGTCINGLFILLMLLSIPLIVFSAKRAAEAAQQQQMEQKK